MEIYKMSELPLCKCGCGRKVTKSKNRYISGHNWKGKKLNKNTIEKLKELQLGESNSFYGKKHSTESRKKMSESRKGKISHRKGKNIPIFRTPVPIVRRFKSRSVGTCQFRRFVDSCRSSLS